ncbi:nucleotidyltransferase family protein [Vibrio hepatarius]|uniref:nucleotidyltransferase family protein n=1 Tax=Vibrio hepatarius TaxID=171383 RepID=UPI001C0A39F8|nr:nucleotidyltransferase family protein [Vibrio hepatarius]MBU2896869.1 nucleotidyltransferase family protein [Vibrio hepatarius]
MKHTFLLKVESKLNEAIEALDRGGIGLLAFIDRQGALIGIVTDGDIRRAILRQTDDLHEIINREPLTMSYHAVKSDVVANLRNAHRRHMPLIDDKGNLKSIFSLDEIEFVSKDNTVVIMAGGLGTRLGNLTKHTPKPMLHVGGKPMLQRIVEQFREQGFHRFIFCLNYKRDVIVDYFGGGKNFGVTIDYVVEKQRLGTAGALSLIDKNLEEPFLVINGDVLTDVDFEEILQYHIDRKTLATMCVKRFEYNIPYGVIKTDNKKTIQRIEEKPTYSFDVNAGIYIFSPSILSHVPRDTFYDMPTLFNSLIDKSLNPSIFHVDKYWLDIGHKEDYRQANLDIDDLV